MRIVLSKQWDKCCASNSFKASLEIHHNTRFTTTVFLYYSQVVRELPPLSLVITPLPLQVRNMATKRWRKHPTCLTRPNVCTPQPCFHWGWVTNKHNHNSSLGPRLCTPSVQLLYCCTWKKPVLANSHNQCGRRDIKGSAVMVVVCLHTTSHLDRVWHVLIIKTCSPWKSWLLAFFPKWSIP